MPFPSDWTIPHEGGQAVPFTCVHCGKASVAVVTTPQVRPQRLVETARELGPLGRCPACGKADEQARANRTAALWGQRALLALATCTGFTLFVLFTFHGVDLGELFTGVVATLGGLGKVGLLLGAPLGVVVAAQASRRWQLDLDQAVRVLAPEDGAKLQALVESTPVKPPGVTPRVAAADDDRDWLIPLGVLGLGIVLAVRFVGTPFNFQFGRWHFAADNDNTAQLVQFAISLGALGIIGWGLKLQWEGQARFKQLLRDRVLVVLGLLGFLGYFNFGHLHFGNFVHVWDTYHYVMGAKYFPELGYEKMYDCAAVANAENGRRDEVVRQTITDLRTNIIVKTDEVLAHPERCKENFSAERWEAYRKDIFAFRAMVGEPRWRDIHLDHGYNATPVWTLAGYFLTNGHGPVTMAQLTRLNLIDPIYLALTLAMIWWAFGPRTFAIAAIVLGCHFPNRYYWTGGAFLRHDWLFYFVASIALLRKNRPGLAGAAFAYTTLLRLFPGLAAAGVAVAAFEYFRVHKKLDPRFVRYVVGGVVATGLLVGASFAFFGGPSTWQRLAQNTIKHANTPLTNHMGLRTALSWRPDAIGQKTVRPGLIDSWHLWKSTRLENWQEAKPVMWLTFLAGLVLVWLALKHTGADPWVGAAMGVGFIVIGAELTNYYYCFLLGLAVLHEKRREVGALLCALAAVSHYLNWGPITWMSHWLDEQYVTMSLAALFAVGGIWWLFTRFAADAVAPAEPPALLLAPAAVAAVPEGKKKKHQR